MLRELRAALARSEGSGGGSAGGGAAAGEGGAAGGGGAAGEGGALLRAIHVRRASAYRVWRRQQAQLREREGEGGGAAQREAHDEEEDAQAGVAETARVVAAGRRGEGRGALALDLLSLGDWLQLVLACLEASLDLPGTVR